MVEVAEEMILVAEVSLLQLRSDQLMRRLMRLMEGMEGGVRRIIRVIGVRDRVVRKCYMQCMTMWRLRKSKVRVSVS